MKDCCLIKTSKNPPLALRVNKFADDMVVSLVFNELSHITKNFMVIFKSLSDSLFLTISITGLKKRGV